MGRQTNSTSSPHTNPFVVRTRWPITPTKGRTRGLLSSCNKGLTFPVTVDLTYLCGPTSLSTLSSSLECQPFSSTPCRQIRRYSRTPIRKNDYFRISSLYPYDPRSRRWSVYTPKRRVSVSKHGFSRSDPIQLRKARILGYSKTLP